MKTKHDTEYDGEMREEYDFSRMKGGVRGKYAKAFDQTVVTILLDPDVAEVFPDSRSVNEALRTLARVLSKNDESAQRTRLDRESEANHDLNRLLDEPGGDESGDFI
jgi:hypothetical protein